MTMPYTKLIKEVLSKLNWKVLGISIFGILLAWSVIDNNLTSKKNIELAAKVEALNTQLKSKDELINALEEKSKVERQLATNLQQSLIEHQEQIANIEKKEAERTKQLAEALDRTEWSKEKVPDELKSKLKRKD
jgi:hypothetical protein|nr:MAG TPA: Protein of unknown function (DUF2570) [Caudoviricetes sp.]